MFRHLTPFALVIALALPVAAQDSNKDSNKNFDVRSNVGDLHIGDDVDARKLGMPIYPGARLRNSDENRNSANLSLLTEAFGFKLVVANYDSDDAPGKVLDFYRNKLKKYGKVLECHVDKHGGDVDVHDNDKDKDKELKCDNTAGPVNELKAGTNDDQHVVSVEPGDAGKGSTFALVYVHTRGKQGDI